MEKIESPDAFSAFATMRLQRAAVGVHQLPPRVLAELLREIGMVNGNLDDVIERTQRYASIPRELLAVTGGDRLVPTVWEVPG